MIVLTLIIIVQAVQISKVKSSYEEESKAGSVMENQIESLNTEIEDLEQVSKNYEKSIQEKDAQIVELEKKNSELQKEIEELKKSPKKVVQTSSTSPNTDTSVKDGNYDQARMVWNYLRDIGLNKYVCAGILGNIMAEVGGQTLDISQWPKYSKNYYYGICQWSSGRKKRLLNDFGTTLEDQIRFLSVELFEVIPKDNSFYNMQDEKEAALYFAKYYERCSSKYYSVRQKNATKALNYFST